MEQTRVNPADLQAALTQAQEHARQIIALLQPFAVRLTDEERATVPRARAGFPDAARALVRGLEVRPDVSQMVRFEGEAVLEDLDNVQALQPLREQLTVIEHMVSDSQLTWTGEAYASCLTAYRVAKVAAKDQGDLTTALGPLAEVFATKRERKG